MESYKTDIYGIFKSNRNLVVPFYQRTYVWDDVDLQRFLDDMVMVSENPKPYFFGSLILKKKETRAVGESALIVIDGQQRLTTLNIFFKVLSIKQGIDTVFVDRFAKKDKVSNILKHNRYDKPSFEKVVNLKTLDSIDGNNDKIICAYNFFKANISDDLVNKIDVDHLIDNIGFIVIGLHPDDDEQEIFDTINSLGVRLSTADLLKNYFFKQDDTDGFFETYWEDVFEKDAECKNFWDREFIIARLSRSFIELFFYSYLQIKTQDRTINVTTKDKNDFLKVVNLFGSYKRFIKEYNQDKTEMIKEIKEYANLFREHFDCGIVDKELSEYSGIERINALIFGLDTTILLTYILYILRNVKDLDQRNNLFSAIETYVMRKIVVKGERKNFNKLFTENLMPNKILTKEQFEQKTTYVSDIELEGGFKSSTLNNKQAVGIIYMIESKIRDKGKHATGLLGLSKYTLEHLMPKNWQNNWGGIPGDKVENRKFMIRTIGNMAIITQSLNGSIRDSAWDVKKNGIGKARGLSHYSSGMETLSPYLLLDQWTEAQIEERSKFLYEKALEVWPIK